MSQPGQPPQWPGQYAPPAMPQQQQYQQYQQGTQPPPMPGGGASAGPPPGQGYPNKYDQQYGAPPTTSAQGLVQAYPPVSSQGSSNPASSLPSGAASPTGQLSRQLSSAERGVPFSDFSRPPSLPTITEQSNGHGPSAQQYGAQPPPMPHAHGSHGGTMASTHAPSVQQQQQQFGGNGGPPPFPNQGGPPQQHYQPPTSSGGPPTSQGYPGPGVSAAGPPTGTAGGTGGPPSWPNAAAAGGPPASASASSGPPPASSAGAARRQYPQQTFSQDQQQQPQYPQGSGQPQGQGYPPQHAQQPYQQQQPGYPGGPQGYPGQQQPQQQQQPYDQQQQQPQYGHNTLSGPPSPIRSSAQQGLPGAPGVDLLRQRHILPTAPMRAPRPDVQDPLRRKNCSPKVIRSTLNNVPHNSSLLKQCRLPFGLHLFPFGNDPVPVIESTVITRCRICRTYINPFVTFLSHGSRWRCNICGRVHEVPQDFDFDPVRREYVDRSSRPELTNGTVEYIAPSEYMLRPPQPCIYLFLLDVSAASVASGFLHTVCETISGNLDRITGDSRTKVGFLCYDQQLHFFNLQSSLAQPKMMTLADIDDPFLPSPEDLVVVLEESKDLVREALVVIPKLFADTSCRDTCLGPALNMAKELLGPIGGRISVFQYGLPTKGEGALKSREDVSQRGSPKEFDQLHPANDFYKQYSVSLSRIQVGIDLFLVGQEYTDLATLAQASQFCGGTTYFYPQFNAHENHEMTRKFVRELGHVLTRPIGLEAVMRVRCSKGLALHTFHGNFFVRSADLLALPNVSPDNGFAFQIAIEEQLGDMGDMAFFQAALLYTSHRGERRIRVHTLMLPIVKTPVEVFAGADQQAVVALVSKMAIDRALNTKLSDARDAMKNLVVDSYNAYRKACLSSQSTAGQLIAPDSMRLMPLYVLALLKHPAFTTGCNVPLDHRAYAHMLLKILPMWEVVDYIYPRLYALHDMDSKMGIKDAQNRLPMPICRHLSAEQLSRGGIYLLTSGQEIKLYVTKEVAPQQCQELFGVGDYSSIPDGLFSLPKLETHFSVQVRNIVAGLRACHHRYQLVTVIKENSAFRFEFFKHLVDDRSDLGSSYYEFLTQLSSEIK